MKTFRFIQFRKLCKYTLITIALIMLTLSVFLFYYNTSNVKAADETTTNTNMVTVNSTALDFNYSTNKFNIKQELGLCNDYRWEPIKPGLLAGRHNTDCNEIFSQYCKKHTIEAYLITVISDDDSLYKEIQKANLVFKNPYTRINTNSLDDKAPTFDNILNDRTMDNEPLEEYCSENTKFYINTLTETDFTNSNLIGATGHLNFDLGDDSLYIPVEDLYKDTYIYSTIITVEECNQWNNSITLPHSSHNMITKFLKDGLSDIVQINKEKLLKNYITSRTGEDINACAVAQKALGCYNANNTTINVNFVEMNSFSEYTPKTISFTMNSASAQSPTLVKKEIYNSLSEYGYDDLSDFNATYTDVYVDANGLHKDLQERIVRTAIDLSFEPDFSQNEVQTINVVYADYDYSSVAIYVSNNGYNIDTELLTMPVYTTNATVDKDNNVTLTFNFDTVERQLKNAVNWLFALDKNNVNVTGVNEGVNVNVTDNAVVVTFNLNNQNALFGLSMTALAEILEDYKITYTFNYAKLDEQLNEEIVTSTAYECMHSDFKNLTNATNFYTLYGSIIDSATAPEVLNGVKYYVYDGVSANVDKESATAVINVNYRYNTLFRITSSTGEVFYTDLYKNSATYNLSELNYNIPKDHRIQKITGDRYVNVQYNDVKPETSVITENVHNATSNANNKLIIELTLEVTDKWVIQIDYLESYYSAVDGAQTPFFQRVSETVEARISDFNKSIYEFNKNDVAKLFGLTTLDLPLSGVENIIVKFNNPTYLIEVDYTPTTVNRIDYDGNIYELTIELSSYADWLEFYGKEWTIRFLNMPETKYFKYTNDIDPEDLYGYFSVAVFEEQVSDWNRIFREDSSVGCMAIFRSTEVVGSDLYKFFGGMTDSILGGVGYVGMALCEIVNDQNAIYESYFFYVDGTSDEAFLSNGGADSNKDTDTGFENKVEDVGNLLTELGASISKWWEESNLQTIITVALIVIPILVLGVFALIIYLKGKK